MLSLLAKQTAILPGQGVASPRRGSVGHAVSERCHASVIPRGYIKKRNQFKKMFIRLVHLYFMFIYFVLYLSLYVSVYQH